MLRAYTDTAVTVTSALVSSVSRFAVQVGVSLVLSFMIVWDLPTIQGERGAGGSRARARGRARRGRGGGAPRGAPARGAARRARGLSRGDPRPHQNAALPPLSPAGARSLATSRLAPVYAEVAPSLTVFGQLFGKALQAQARIALVNTGLTAAGMWALRIPGLGLLSLFVFLCSFIPIAGCFISTVPIAFVALTEYGFLKARGRGGGGAGGDTGGGRRARAPRPSLTPPPPPDSSRSSSSWCPASTSSRRTASTPPSTRPT